MAHPMKKIWQARDLILSGYSVTEVVERTGLTRSVVYSYTKSERARIKKKA